MKRSILILAVLFVIAGFLDWIVCNKKTKANKIKAEDIYQIIEDDDGNHFEEPYKIEGKYLRFEKNCKTIHFIDYGLFNLSDLTANYSDAVSPKEIMIRENGISRPYFLFDNLKTDFYILTFVSHNYKKTTSYISNEINLPVSKTFSYFELMPYFDKLGDNLVIDSFDVTLPLIIDYNFDIENCSGYNYKFYYKGKDLFVDYYNYASDNEDIDIDKVYSHKLNKEILDVIKNKELRLNQINTNNDYSYSGITVSFLHNNSIKVYSDFNTFDPLYSDIQDYIIK